MEKKIILELTVQEVNTILAGLGELSAKLSMNLILQIETTANEQLKEVAPVANASEGNITLPDNSPNFGLPDGKSYCNDSFLQDNPNVKGV